jgi:16S rRNA (adenine1518-N6/adenine1519-N6)-dimethyltransferase
MTTRGHTQSQLRQLLGERGVSPRASLGQCFLIDLNLLDIMLAHAELTARDFVLEVGAGTGSMTQRLAQQAGSVLSVEIDPGLYQLARETVAAHANVRLMHADILKNKNTLNPEVIATVRAMAPPGSPTPRKLVANLPYVVATPVISLLLLEELPWDRMVVTIQQELANRLMAAPGSKDYGSLSVLVQALADVRVVRELPPSAFWPRPKVRSASVLIEPSSAKRSAIRDPDTFHSFVRSVLLHRRKNLRGALDAAWPDVGKDRITEWLNGLGIDPTTRAEALPVGDFIRLSASLPRIVP